MADAIALAVRSGIFGARNTQKDYRQPVVVGQTARVVENISTLDNKIGKSAKSALEAFKMAAQDEKVLQYAGKAVKFASDNINPLICISTGIKVLAAEDKESALVTNGTALASMFAVEHLMKKHMDEIPKLKCFEGIAEKVMKFSSKNKYTKAIPSIISGIAFVVGSCTAYSAGEKFGNLLMGEKGKAK